MIIVEGKYNIAKIMVDYVEPTCMSQIVKMINHPALEGDPIVIMPDTHAGMGSVIGFTMPIGDKIVPNIVGVDIGCVDKDTEFLSPNGWKKISDWNGEEVMQYSPDTDIGEFVNPTAYIKQLCSEFIHLKTKYGIDQVLSPDHRCLVYRHDRSGIYTKYSVESAESILDKHKKLKLGYRHRFLTSFTPKDDREGVQLSDATLRVAVAVCADGTLAGKAAILSLKKKRKIERIKELLEKANIEYTHTYPDPNCERFRFCSPIAKKGIDQFWNSTNRQLDIISDEVIYWDGNAKDQCFYTRKKLEADFINYVFSATGNRSTIQVDFRSDGIDYRVFKLKNTKVGISGTPKTDMKLIPSEDGYKYCFSVPSTFLILRRNGNVFITGNCGVDGYPLPISKGEIDFKALDEFIRENIPHGFVKHSSTKHAESIFGKLKLLGTLEEVCNRTGQELDYVLASLGSLGSGNHFCEVNQGVTEGGSSTTFLIIHSGSRNFGLKICNYHQKKAVKIHGPGQKDLAYLEGEDKEEYLHDMKVAQQYAQLNRAWMAAKIIDGFFSDIMDGRELGNTILTTHNYINFEDNIIRKGAIQAREGQLLLIPLNMRDGTILARGKGNPDWNYSAPHGAGRKMSRGAAKKSIKLEDFREQMKGIWTSCVHKSTLDEAPDAYKDSNVIFDTIEETAEIIDVLKPVYNFKG